MKFYDKAKLTVQSGKGGDGVVSARREAGVPYGGPAGGNGGKGGSVILKANPHLNTLVDFHNQKKLVAPNGDPGRTKEQYGKNAEDLVIGLPLGSIVRDAHTGKPLWHCYHADDTFVMCRGGQGGIGNMHFKNAVNQYPQFALLGEPGEIREIEIELQLLADVALIGTPSVGKSSLINTVANVKAKVADYPFTTLIPNLGSVKHRDVSFNMVDVPGLIEGASSGKGLGNEFLRHIMKARVWAFMMDLSRYESGMHEFETLAHEIIQYMGDTLKVSKDFGQVDDIVFDFFTENRGLQLVISAVRGMKKESIITKDIMFVYNKADAVNDDEVIQECIHYSFVGIQAFLKKIYQCEIAEEFFMQHVHITSTYARTGIDEFLNDLVENHEVGSMQEFLREDIIIEPKPIAPRPGSRDSIEIRETTAADVPGLLEQGLVDEQDIEYAKVWYIKEREVARLTYMLPRGNDEAEMWYWNVLDKKKLLQKLVTAGLVKGDIIHVQSFYTGVEDRFIRY